MDSIEENDDLVAKIKIELERRGWKICTCESLTCGLIAAAFGRVSGISAVYEGGLVTYATAQKSNLAHVDNSILEKYGAVSEQAAMQMCTGAASVMGCQVCVSATGNAGPLPMEEKRVGLVYIGIKTGDNVIVKELNLSGTRDEIRRKTVTESLRILYENL